MNPDELSLILAAILTKGKYFMDKKEMIKYMFEVGEMIYNQMEVNQNVGRNTRDKNR